MDKFTHPEYKVGDIITWTKNGIWSSQCCDNYPGRLIKPLTAKLVKIRRSSLNTKDYQVGAIIVDGKMYGVSLSKNSYARFATKEERITHLDIMFSNAIEEILTT